MTCLIPHTQFTSKRESLHESSSYMAYILATWGHLPCILNIFDCNLSNIRAGYPKYARFVEGLLEIFQIIHLICICCAAVCMGSGFKIWSDE